MRIFFPSLLFTASGIGAALAWLGLTELLPPVPVQPAIPQVARVIAAPAETTQPGLAPLPVISEEQRAALASRPLFSETRSPAFYAPEPPPEPDPEPIYQEPEPEPVYEEPIEEEPEPEPLPEPDLTLAGFIRTEGVARVLLFHQATGQDRWYALGATIEGWEIVAIEQDRVVFAQNGFEFVVKLER